MAIATTPSAADRRARARAARGRRGRALVRPPRSTGCSLGAVAGARRLRALGDRRDHAPRRRRRTRTTTSCGRRVYAAVGLRRASSSRSLVNPRLYRRYWRADLRRAPSALMLLVFARRPGDARLAALARPRLFRFQPSEFGKLLFVLALAGFLAERGRRDRRAAHDGARAIGLAARPDPARLRAARPRHGARLRAPRSRAVLFVAGTRWPHLAVLGALARSSRRSASSGCCPRPGSHVLKPYQVQRLDRLHEPDARPGGRDLQRQPVDDRGRRRRRRGRGVGGATQTNLDYLPEHATDFVFASLAEQRGFVGAAVLLLLYLLVVWRGLRIVTVARDAFSAIVAGGIVVALLFQIFVNVGMTMGIAPITGIPLPFVCVGGSSMIANLAAMGVLLAIHAARHARSRRR